ncbi:MAG TPA: hypothetical protein VGI81_00785 [Tepidisphaeraceae bacterium]|jgi:hypothetical protein
MKTTIVGKRVFVSDLAEAYERVALEDECVAVELLRAGRFRHAMYQVVQGMEKRIRAASLRLGESPEAFCQRAKNHSLEEALDGLVAALTRHDLAKDQVEDMLFRHVLQGIRFDWLHNDLRYPFYLSNRRTSAVLEVTRTDVEQMLMRSHRLQVYLKDLGRLQSASG